MLKTKYKMKFGSYNFFFFLPKLGYDQPGTVTFYNRSCPSSPMIKRNPLSGNQRETQRITLMNIMYTNWFRQTGNIALAGDVENNVK